MRHPVHELLQRFLDSQQFAFDARERALWPSERFPQDPHGRTDRAAEPSTTGAINGELEYRN